MKKWYGFGAIIVILALYFTVGTIEYRQEIAMHNQEIEAAQAELQHTQRQINKLKADLKELDEYAQAVSANLGDLRFRLGLEMEMD